MVYLNVVYGQPQKHSLRNVFTGIHTEAPLINPYSQNDKDLSDLPPIYTIIFLLTDNYLLDLLTIYLTITLIFKFNSSDDLPLTYSISHI